MSVFNYLAVIGLFVMPLASGEITEAETVVWQGVENSYRVSDELYRSGQPDEEGFRAIEAMGIKTILNLREYHKDDKKASKTNLLLLHYPVAAGAVTTADLAAIMRLIRNAPKPLLVHCWHGSDRTGIVVATYRIIEQGADVDAAEKEFTDERFGHHEFWYGNLRRLLRSTDWADFKKTLDAPPAS